MPNHAIIGYFRVSDFSIKARLNLCRVPDAASKADRAGGLSHDNRVAQGGHFAFEFPKL